MVEVAAAVIERADGAFLLAQRPAGKVYAGWWEFPGGKVHAGESTGGALARELHEELGIEVARAFPWIPRVHVYEHATVMLHFFRVVEWSGEPRPREGQAFVWQRLDAPVAEPILPANGPVLASLALPLEYAITDAQTLGTAEQLARVEARMKGGLRLIQVRDKDNWERSRLIYTVASMARQYGAKVLVNGGPAGDGIHLTAEQLMTKRAPATQARSSATPWRSGWILSCSAPSRRRNHIRMCRCSAGTASGTSPNTPRSPSTRSAGCAWKIWTTRAAPVRTASR